ncbi:phage tail protein [Peribacillus sp. JNUCC41]|uniref:phage tail protein n=1 Tax=Peribacillus sp. JNUCC41 TaxID=2778370 RepID=UPI0017840945|nr:hypothetical protein [Brevibacillus sp. JNUCC-41]QOS88673.1 hypothetical protein JNUCC41_17830 [Brevibacillus sp. JNUCC-41]
MGLIQVFSGLFTGDFSKMWIGIKNIFSGSIQFIWNFMQRMFWDKMLKGIISEINGKCIQGHVGQYKKCFLYSHEVDRGFCKESIYCDEKYSEYDYYHFKKTHLYYLEWVS